MKPVDRKLLLQTLRGYIEVNRITEAERRARLINLSETESRAIFNSLYRDASILKKSEDLTSSATYHVDHHLKVREAMRRLAYKKGYESTI